MNSVEKNDAEVSGSQTNSERHNEEKPFLKVFVHSFFIIPFLIAVFCVLLFTGIHLLTQEKKSVYDYLEDVKTGGLTKRWQGAFELSKIVANPRHVPKEERFINELTKIFEQSRHDDNRVRQYLALAMGRTGNPVFTDIIIKGLSDEKEESVAALIYALGMLKDGKAAESVTAYADHPNARIRSVAVVALGALGSPDSIQILKNKLGDSEPNVQWGAAISLAQMGDPSGKEIIRQLMDRRYLTRFPEIDANETNHLMMAAIEASSILKDENLMDQIKNLSVTDQNMKVRSAALECLNNGDE